jgi:hypothetical protein
MNAERQAAFKAVRKILVEVDARNDIINNLNRVYDYIDEEHGDGFGVNSFRSLPEGVREAVVAYAKEVADPEDDEEQWNDESCAMYWSHHFDDEQRAEFFAKVEPKK